MPKRTSNSSVNSSIRQNTTATNEGFSQLLQLQRASNDYLQTIQSTLAQGLVMQRVSAIEELIIAKETGQEEKSVIPVTFLPLPVPYHHYSTRTNV